MVCLWIWAFAATITGLYLWWVQAAGLYDKGDLNAVDLFGRDSLNSAQIGLTLLTTIGLPVTGFVSLGVLNGLRKMDVIPTRRVIGVLLGLGWFQAVWVINMVLSWPVFGHPLANISYMLWMDTAPKPHLDTMIAFSVGFLFTVFSFVAMVIAYVMAAPYTPPNPPLPKPWLVPIPFRPLVIRLVALSTGFLVVLSSAQAAWYLSVPFFTLRSDLAMMWLTQSAVVVILIGWTLLSSTQGRQDRGKPLDKLDIPMAIAWVVALVLLPMAVWTVVDVESVNSEPLRIIYDVAGVEDEQGHTTILARQETYDPLKGPMSNMGNNGINPTVESHNQALRCDPDCTPISQGDWSSTTWGQAIGEYGLYYIEMVGANGQYLILTKSIDLDSSTELTNITYSAHVLDSEMKLMNTYQVAFLASGHYKSDSLAWDAGTGSLFVITDKEEQDQATGLSYYNYTIWSVGLTLNGFDGQPGTVAQRSLNWSSSLSNAEGHISFAHHNGKSYIVEQEPYRRVTDIEDHNRRYFYQYNLTTRILDMATGSSDERFNGQVQDRSNTYSRLSLAILFNANDDPYLVVFDQFYKKVQDSGSQLVNLVRWNRFGDENFSSNARTEFLDSTFISLPMLDSYFTDYRNSLLYWIDDNGELVTYQLGPQELENESQAERSQSTHWMVTGAGNNTITFVIYFFEYHEDNHHSDNIPYHLSLHLVTYDLVNTTATVQTITPMFEPTDASSSDVLWPVAMGALGGTGVILLIAVWHRFELLKRPPAG